VRPTYAEVDLAAIAHNVAGLRDLIAPAKVCAVVKADAYGHGDVPVAGAALEAGADWLAVALVEEGIRLREAGLEAPILVLSEPGLDSVAEFGHWALTPAVYSVGFIEALGSVGRDLGVHLKVDTGMHRVGAAPDRALELAGLVRSQTGLRLDAVWTHFAVADEDPAFTRHQVDLFDEVAATIEAPMTHMANTAGALLFPESRGDMCRVGLGIYGLHPCRDTEGIADLRPAMRVVSRVAHVRRLEAGSRPSYGRIRALGRDATVATVPIGYADGFARALVGDVLISGMRRPLAGRVTMDQIVVEVGDDPVAVGDEVVLLGRQGDAEITADERAAELGTVSYEVLCTVGPRVPRRYVR
jgi:alanine racemase